MDKARTNLFVGPESSSDWEVETHTLSDGLPVPDESPVASLHQLPHLLKQLAEAVAVAQSRVPADTFEGVANPALLRWCKTGTANDKAWDEQQGLTRITRFDRVEDRQGLVHGDGDASVVVRGVAYRSGRLGTRFGRMTRS
jgi:hypothetical protein